MKKNILKLGLLTLIITATVSCKNKEKELADQRINELEGLVDSLKTVSEENRNANYEAINTNFQDRNAKANEALMNVKEDKSVQQSKIDAANSNYKDYKVIVVTKPEPVAKVILSANQILRDRYFGAGKIGDDMNFDWVNKDNILNTYDKFFQFYKANKKDFSREDYDETKLMYEALDSRKNTVEKEGLTSVDNGKIASIKFKFSSMFGVNRMGAKARENTEAKQQ
jgi:hypothetical protein